MKILKVVAVAAALAIVAYGILTFVTLLLLPPVGEAVLVQAVFGPHEILLEQYGYRNQNQFGPQRHNAADRLPSCFTGPKQWVAIDEVEETLSCEQVSLSRNSLPVEQCNPVQQRNRDRRPFRVMPPELIAIYAVAGDSVGQTSVNALHEARSLPKDVFVSKYGLGPEDDAFREVLNPKLSFVDCRGFSLIKIHSQF